MDIPCHTLRQNHASTLPNRCMYLDCETAATKDGERAIHHMEMAWTCRVEYEAGGRAKQEHWQLWRQSSAMWKWVAASIHNRTSLYLFAHNAFFDLQCSGFFEWFTKDGWVLQFVYEKGLTYILVCRKGKRTLKVLSTTNYFKASLRTLGEMIGLPKLDVSFGHSTGSELERYCRRDVEIIRAGMESYFDFIRRHDFGSFGLTIPSQAMRAFRHRFMDEKVYIHQFEKAQELEREGYFGGRTECFRIGRIDDGPVLTLDVNSMYPYVMSSQAVPTALVDWIEDPDERWLKDALRRHCVTARVDLETDQPIYPVMHNNRLCFPTGQFRTVLSTPAVVEAVKRGHIRRVWQVACYKKAVLFRDYVNELYPLKQRYDAEKREVWRYLTKLLLNGLYGKWAQREPVTEEGECTVSDGYAREEILDLVTGRTLTETRLMNRRYTVVDEQPGKHSFVAISSHITEAARVYLYQLMEIAGRDCVLYCDTDSIKIRQRHLKPLRPYLHHEKIGRMKVEKLSDVLIVHGLKCYEEDGSRVMKGISKKARRLSIDTFEMDHFLKQPSHLRERRISGVIHEKLLKRLKLTYDKGTVLSDGRVIPFHFGLDVRPDSLPHAPQSVV